MNHHSWVLLDTETNGIKAPIYVVEIGAQKMKGWLPDGPPFRRLLNHNANISPEASRVNGYTREILERDGDDPLAVYRDFAAYAGGLPVVAYNLAFDWDQVLLPEWQRMGLGPIGQRGLCALELARRLVDPVPAGNCKLQTLRQFYRLPERGAHTALGDVQTVVDLLGTVLRPLAEARGLHTWDDLLALTEATWFPSLIAFGKFKGRNFREAAADSELHGWLQWLAGSSNARSASMGQWYLAQLETEAPPQSAMGVATNNDAAASEWPDGSAVVLYLSPQKAELQRLIDAARERLTTLEADYTAQKHAVDAALAQLFQALRPHYQRRDQLRLNVDFRREYLDALMRSGDDEAQEVEQAHAEARQRTNAEYEQAAFEAASKQALTDEQAQEMKDIWRKLVRMFHPDRCMDDPEKRRAHEWLTAEINQARDRGDIQRLREIAQNPDAFLSKHGMAALSQDDSSDVRRLRTLLNALQQRILETLETLNILREAPGYELHQRMQQDSAFFATTVAQHQAALEAEMAQLEAEAARLAEEIEGLTGVAPADE